MNNKSSKFISFINGKVFLISYLIFNILFVLFCCVPLPIILYSFAKVDVDVGVVTTLFSTDCVIFSVLVALFGILISFAKKKDNGVGLSFVDVLVITTLTSIGGLFLVATSLSLFSNDTKLYSSFVFSSLYFLALIFENYIFILLRLFINHS